MDKMILTEKQQRLLIDNYRLATNFINKAVEENKIPENMRDDFESEIFLKFCLSALKYDGDTGFRFSTYAYGGFNYGLESILKKKRVRQNNLFLDDSYEQLEQKINKRVENNVLYDFLNDAGLDERDKLMTMDYYINKLSFNKIGVKYNLTKEGARLVVKKVLQKLHLFAKKNKLNIDDFYE